VAELDTLNSALGILFDRLREARRLFEQEGDEGRAGTFTALGALWMFIVLFKTPFSDGLHVPILRLQDALVMLEQNRVLPILKPILRGGRPASSHAHLSLKGHAAGAVQLLLQTGMSRPDAHRLVAKCLTQLAVRPEGRSRIVTPTTVRNWCAELSSDVGRRGTAAMMYDRMFNRAEQERFSALPRDQARQCALEVLAAWVRALFPDLRKSN
jgi:hypothetical protein